MKISWSGYWEKIVGSVVSSHGAIISSVADLASSEIVLNDVPYLQKKINENCLINLWWFDFLHFSVKFLNRKHGRHKTIDQRHFMPGKDSTCIGKIIWIGSFCHEWGFYTRKRERLLLGKNWTQRCNRIMLRTNMMLQFFKKERGRSLVIFPSESLESLRRLFLLSKSS